LKTIHLTTEDLADFFTEFCLLRQAALTEKEALALMLESENKKSIQHFLTSVINAPDLLSGIEQFSHTVPAYLIALLHQAKKNNTELTVLTDIAQHLNDLSFTDSGFSYRQKLKGCLMYPAFILVLVLTLTILLLIYIVPIFSDMFNSFGSLLPLPTQFFIHLSLYVQQYIGLILILFLGLIVYFLSPYSQHLKSKLLLNLPLIGRVVRSIESVTILKTLHLLCSYQFSFTQALHLSASASQNMLVINALTQTTDKTIKDDNLTENLQQIPVFSAKTRRLLALFAKTQQLQLLKNLSDYYDKLIPGQTALSLRVLNTVLLLSCWLIVGAIVIAVYLPIFAIGEAVG
jgi:type IV pilus assembly protein PilC